MSEQPKHLVDRDAFMALALSGVLLERGRYARVFVPDTTEVHAAVEACERGEPVGLVVDYRLFSVIQDDGEAYVERRV